RYPIYWSADPAADFDSLACTIRSGLCAGLSGIPFWSNDIGAYRGMPSPRLYVRWAQFGLLCSHSRMHGDSPREPWYFGAEATAIVRRYARLRNRLFPYLYSTSYDAIQTGMPVIRALALAFPDDPGGFREDLEYMLGDWLLVAPIYDESDQRTVYLPPGEWIDYWKKVRHVGPAHIRVDAPLDTLPLFVRAGAIIPMVDDHKRIPEGLIDPLILEIYPAQQMHYSLLEDEGVTEFDGALTDRSFTLSWRGGPERARQLRIVGLESAVRAVHLQTVDGQQVPISNWRITDEAVIEIPLPACGGARVTIDFASA
ncbi:MAG: hypothetical protein KC547_16210, partial [Anaerolineae bacterium]|nr:hypothetical protein [Anaerolineae bacterium]